MKKRKRKKESKAAAEHTNEMSYRLVVGVTIKCCNLFNKRAPAMQMETRLISQLTSSSFDKFQLTNSFVGSSEEESPHHPTKFATVSQYHPLLPPPEF
ncbi:hypothetical protein AgCh_036383 [Apium graveolens]